MVCDCNPGTWEQEQEGLWGSLDSQPSLLGELQANERLSQKTISAFARITPMLLVLTVNLTS